MDLSINIIHNSLDTRRMEMLIKELKSQDIHSYSLWESVYDERGVQHGISRAHKQIVEFAKDNDFDEVLIMEDDIKFLGEGAFKYYIDNKPSDFDIYLAGIFLGIITVQNTTAKFTGMTCYIVNSRFYDTFLNVNEKEHIDIALSGLGKYVVCNPFTVTQHNGYSSNTQRHENYEAIFSHRKLYNNFT